MRRGLICLFVLLVVVVTACNGVESREPPAAGSATPEASLPAATPTPTRTPVPVDAIQTPAPGRVTRSALEDIRTRGEVRVGVLYNYPPLAFMANNGQVQGYEATLARRMAERWGVDIRFVQVTRQTRLPMLIDGEVDMLAAAMIHQRELEQYVEFSDTSFSGGYVVLARSDAGLDLESALASGSIGVLGADSDEIVRQQAAERGLEIATQPFASVDEAVAALLDGNISIVVGHREHLMLSAQSNEQLALLDGFLLPEPYAFAVRRGDTPMRDLINLTLRDLIAEGEIGAIFSQSFYGLPADLFAERLGEPVYTYDSLPADISTAPSVLDRIRNGEGLRVAGFDLAAEPALFDSQPIYDGYNRAVINEMARRWGVPVVEIPDSAAVRGLERLLAGEADIVVGVRSDRSLTGQAATSAAYYVRSLRLVHRRDVTVFNVLDLEFKPVYVVTPVDESQDLVEDNNQFPEIEAVGSFEDAFNGLQSRAVYAVVGDEYALTLMAESDSELVLDERRYRPRDYVMALPLYDSDFLALVNFTLQDMYVDGTLNALRQQYFGQYLPPDTELEELTFEIWPGDGSFLGVGG